MKRLAAALCLALFTVPTFAASKSDVKIVNQSDWAIHHLFLSSVDDDQWGPDQLGELVIGPGETFTLRNIPCDHYDVKLIDEEGDECVLGGVEVCKQNQSWVINSEDLATCQGY